MSAGRLLRWAAGLPTSITAALYFGGVLCPSGWRLLTTRTPVYGGKEGNSKARKKEDRKERIRRRKGKGEKRKRGQSKENSGERKESK